MSCSNHRAHKYINIYPPPSPRWATPPSPDGLSCQCLHQSRCREPAEQPGTRRSRLQRPRPRAAPPPAPRDGSAPVSPKVKRSSVTSCGTRTRKRPPSPHPTHPIVSHSERPHPPHPGPCAPRVPGGQAREPWTRRDLGLGVLGGPARWPDGVAFLRFYSTRVRHSYMHSGT